ncbi:IS21 family transposase [Arthrobacter globiformis]|uniref:IS21 family transposase n=1 Tax=Arthrobacter globiformis TaxID=1665 RepID=A0A328HF14_ARTGO|nr:IS21 family transposase [Arthrobacter globiformis]RAM35466.1 IS21 family transposase [Arthrobacter globiformis]RAM35546.1 IS21 family transposase [Arthrobacter globiformis]RAM36741.1 IS21 family transposase [Arthrobacter globiformis]RAM36774.1 IS21 family transposase [Arthrobacter globiformis]RAM36778.1 IS21 family transposase [Arthrobacter globiformis]
MITVEDWALIRRLHLAEGESMRSIAARLGISRNTVAKAVSSDGPPAYVRAPQDSGIKAVEPAIRALLQENPRMPATVLAERVGWSGSAAWFRENVARIRPEYAPADPADRITYDPGDQAQCDLWFPEVQIPVGAGKTRVLPVLVMVSSHSRFIMARMIPSRMTGDLLAGMWELLGSLGAVPRRLIWDNETGIGRRNSYAAGVAAFAGVLATRVVQVKPYDPESKGVVERANQFLETSFLPGRVFTSPEDFNAQLAMWLPKANARLVRRTGARPAELINADKKAMLALPPVPPVTGFTARVRLPRDYYVRMGSNDYSVHPQAIGRFVEVTADLETVTISLDGRTVGTHTRSWGKGLTITDPDHVEAAKALRKAFQTPQPVGETAGLRDLADYDRAFGVILDDGQVA